MPVIVKLNYEDGTEEVLRFPAEVWRLNDVQAKKIIPTSKKKAVGVCSVFADDPEDRADIINFLPFMELSVRTTVGHQF